LLQQFRHQGSWPDFMDPFIKNVGHVRGDGNCGFRAIARVLGLGDKTSPYGGSDGWFLVRQDLIKELTTAEIPPYVTNLGGKKMYLEALERLEVATPKTPIPRRQWMRDSDVETVVPNAYSRPFVIWGDGYHTYLPNRAPPPTSIVTQIVLAFVDTNHWVPVELQEVGGLFPLPPVHQYWYKAKHTVPEALGWADHLKAHFDLWVQLKQQQ